MVRQSALMICKDYWCNLFHGLIEVIYTFAETIKNNHKMKKLFAVALFALPFSGLLAQSSEVTYDLQDGKKGGRIEAVYPDGSATLADNITGKVVRINGTSLEASNFTLIIGTPVVYIEIQTGSGTETAIVDDLNGLIR